VGWDRSLHAAILLQVECRVEVEEGGEDVVIVAMSHEAVFSKVCLQNVFVSTLNAGRTGEF